MNKAAILLATMSPDMVEDIVELVQNRGRATITDVASSDDGAPRPLAVFSRNYITDEDFPHVYMGFTTVMLASMRTLNSDFDFYEKTLMNAFSLPRQIATPIAKQIETYDVLGGVAAEDRRAWYTKMSQRIQETIRQSSNWAASVLQLPFENDQDQSFDIDYLYELKLLGKAVDDLASRSRLMTAQSAISQGMGLYRVGDGETGDVEGDADFEAEAFVGDVFAPLMGNPMPPSIFGGLKGIANVGRVASQARAHKVIEAAGLSKAPHSKGQIQSPVLRKAMDKIVNIKPGKLAMLAGGIGFAPLAIKAIRTLVKANKGSKQTGDVVDRLADHFGEEFAQKWQIGDVTGILDELTSLSGPLETTGDPEMDELIIGDVLSEMEEEGDIYESGDVEIGGLFKRMRINRAIKRGRRRTRRSTKKFNRQRRRDREQQDLDEARDYSQGANMSRNQFSEDQGDDQDYSQDDSQDNGDGGNLAYDDSQFN